MNPEKELLSTQLGQARERIVQLEAELWRSQDARARGRVQIDELMRQRDTYRRSAARWDMVVEHLKSAGEVRLTRELLRAIEINNPEGVR